MNPIRIFALLSTRVPPSDMQPGATGAPEIDAATAAGLCAGMPEHWYKAAVAKWGIDESVHQWLRIELWRAAMELAQREGWRTSKRSAADKPITLLLAELSLLQFYDPARWARPAQWPKRADYLGLRRSAYFKTWNYRLCQVHQTLDDWAGNAWLYVDRRQAERQEDSEKVAS